MDQFTKTQLLELVEHKSEFCASIYMKTYSAGWDLQQNPVRFKNHIGEMEKQLVRQGMRSSESHELLGPAYGLYGNSFFWSHQSKGLAVFLARDFFRSYRLPENFTEIATLANHFYCKPLFRILTDDSPYFLLVLDVKGSRLFRGTHYSFTHIESAQLGTGLDETLFLDTQEKQVQFSSKPSITGANPTTVFGYGQWTDKRKKTILNYFHKVNDSVRKLLENNCAPLVLAGLDYLHPIYKMANTYPYLLDKGISSDVQSLHEEELHVRSWEIMESRATEETERAFSRYTRLSEKSSPVATHDMKAILEGARYGKIQSLFIVDGTVHRWGHYDEKSGDLLLHEQQLAGDEDLLDDAAVHTMLTGGEVFVLRPEQARGIKSAGALLRY